MLVLSVDKITNYLEQIKKCHLPVAEVADPHPLDHHAPLPHPRQWFYGAVSTEGNPLRLTTEKEDIYYTLHFRFI